MGAFLARGCCWNEKAAHKKHGPISGYHEEEGLEESWWRCRSLGHGAITFLSPFLPFFLSFHLLGWKRNGCWQVKAGSVFLGPFFSFFLGDYFSPSQMGGGALVARRIPSSGDQPPPSHWVAVGYYLPSLPSSSSYRRLFFSYSCWCFFWWWPLKVTTVKGSRKPDSYISFCFLLNHLLLLLNS